MNKSKKGPPNAIVRAWRKYKRTIFICGSIYGILRLLLTQTGLRDVDPMLFVQIGMAMVMQIAQVAMYFGFFFYMLGGRIRAKLYQPGDLKFTWDDYIGSHAVKDRLKLLVNLLTVGKSGLAKQLGGVRAAHTALVGPPGTGKTYAAKIIAAMAGVPVLSVEASSLLGTFVGIGPLKVWNLFRKANKLSRVWGGCILYLDEIDAIASGRAGARGGGTFSLMGGNMGGQILSTFLSCMSGLNEPSGLGHRVRAFLRDTLGIPYHWQSPNVLVLVATNIPLQQLDQALFRSGRIGQHIDVGLPNKEDLVELCEYFLLTRTYDFGVVGVPHDDTCVPPMMARIARGCSQADIERAMNDAKRLAVERAMEGITLELWLQAVIEARAGLKQPLPLSERDVHLLSYHEAGHAFMAIVLGEEIVISTIERYGGRGLGHVQHMPVEEHALTTGADVERAVAISIASLAAENVLAERTPGTTSDLDNVKRLIILLISQGIVGNPLMVKMPKETGGQTSGAALPIAELTDDGHALATEYFDFRLAEAETVIKENHQAVDALAWLLAEERTVGHARIVEYLEGLWKPYQLEPFYRLIKIKEESDEK